jgi:Ulp1 family protease
VQGTHIRLGVEGGDIYFADLCGLLTEEKFISDEILNASLSLIDREARSVVSAPSVFVTSLLWGKLFGTDTPSTPAPTREVRDYAFWRWSRKSPDLARAENIRCAVNIRNKHWVLLNINLRVRAFEIYDSWSGDEYAADHTRIFDRARAFMGMLWSVEQLGQEVQVPKDTGFPPPASTLILEDWIAVNWRRSSAGGNFPTQPVGSNDCALYVVFFFAALRLGVCFFYYTDSKAMRVHLAASLFKGRITQRGQ